MTKEAFLQPTRYPLDWAQLTVADLPAALEEGLATARTNMAAIESLPLDGLTYQNLIEGMDRMSEGLDHAWGIANHLSSVNDSPELRAVIEKYLPPITEYYGAITLSEALWIRVKKYAQSDEAKTLEPLHARNLMLTVDGYRRSGAELSPKDKAELLALKSELATTCEQFSKTVLDATNTYEKIVPLGAEATTLRGLPESALAAARASAQSVGKQDSYRFTLQAPSVLAILTYADDRELRHELWSALQQIGALAPHDTLPLIKKILGLRIRYAQLLGYPHFAEMTVQRRMLRPTEKIQAFIDDLAARTVGPALKEFERLVAYKKSQGDMTPFEPWDRAYYGEKLYQQEYSLSTEALRPYFQFEKVLESLFTLSRTLFGVECTKVGGHESWHESVAYYEMRHSDNGELIGGFYTDFWPRKSKRSGAWMNSLVTGRPTQSGGLSPHVALICGNFTAPTPDKPALLTHDEVETLYHEFGHLLHHMLTTVPLPSLAGTNVPRDFVELPSQLLENYCYSPQYLPTLARHYQTGEPIDTATIERLRASEKYLALLQCTRQLGFATLDMYLHTQTEVPADIDAQLETVLEKFRLPYATQPRSSVRSFSHIFADSTGYAAGYYSYKWSEVLESDVWEKFERAGILSPAIGAAYRDTILSQGYSQEPEVLVERLMGRPVSLEPYLRGLGVL